MDKTVLYNKINYYENVIPDFDTFDKILKKVDTGWETWHSSSDKNHIYGETRSFDILRIEELEDPLSLGYMSYIFHAIKNTFYNVAKDYAESIGDYDEPRFFPSFDIKKYYTGTCMGSHFDQLQGDTSLRYSFVLYLNDEYEGGEISFKMVDYKNDVMKKPWIEIDYDEALELKQFDVGIKPKANSLIIFPSSAPYFHTAHLVKTGFKYMITGHWIHNDMKLQGFAEGEEPQ